MAIVLTFLYLKFLSSLFCFASTASDGVMGAELTGWKGADTTSALEQVVNIWII